MQYLLGFFNVLLFLQFSFVAIFNLSWPHSHLTNGQLQYKLDRWMDRWMDQRLPNQPTRKSNFRVTVYECLSMNSEWKMHGNLSCINVLRRNKVLDKRPWKSMFKKILFKLHGCFFLSDKPSNTGRLSSIGFLMMFFHSNLRRHIPLQVGSSCVSSWTLLDYNMFWNYFLRIVEVII